MGWEMGIEPTRKLELKRLPDAGGTHRSASEPTGAINGRGLDVEASLSGAAVAWRGLRRYRDFATASCPLLIISTGISVRTGLLAGIIIAVCGAVGVAQKPERYSMSTRTILRVKPCHVAR